MVGGAKRGLRSEAEEGADCVCVCATRSIPEAERRMEAEEGAKGIEEEEEDEEEDTEEEEDETAVLERDNVGAARAILGETDCVGGERGKGAEGGDEGGADTVARPRVGVETAGGGEAELVTSLREAEEEDDEMEAEAGGRATAAALKARSSVSSSSCARALARNASR